MLYRIRFNPKVSKWMIELEQWQLFWAPCRNEEGILYFELFTDARAYVDKIGLDEAYKDRTVSFAHALATQGVLHVRHNA